MGRANRAQDGTRGRSYRTGYRTTPVAPRAGRWAPRPIRRSVLVKFLHHARSAIGVWDGRQCEAVPCQRLPGPVHGFLDVPIVNLALPSIQRGIGMYEISPNYIFAPVAKTYRPSSSHATQRGRHRGGALTATYTDV